MGDGQQLGGGGGALGRLTLYPLCDFLTFHSVIPFRATHPSIHGCCTHMVAPVTSTQVCHTT